MPLYDYDCAACGRRFEVVHGVHAEGPTVCPICGSGPIRKAISAAAVHYKGSGWAKKERRAPAAASFKGSGEGGSSERGSSDGGSSERGSSERGSSDGGSSERGSSEAAARADGSNETSSSGSTTSKTGKPVETGSAAKGD